VFFNVEDITFCLKNALTYIFVECECVELCIAIIIDPTLAPGKICRVHTYIPMYIPEIETDLLLS
jgi:hypothetical protein